MRMTIARKGLILVAVPLVFELVFAAILTEKLKETEARIDKQLRAQSLIEHTTILMRELVGTSFSICFRYLSEEPPGDLQESRHAVMDTYQTLEKKVGNDRQLKPLCGQIKHALNTFFETLQNFSEMSPSELLSGLTSGGQTMNEIREDMRLIDRSVRKLRAALTHGSEWELPDETASDAASLKLMLLEGILASALLTILLALNFARSISTKLSRLAENTRRVSKNLSPLPALTGSDEVSSLDKSIQEMSERLQAAEYQRKQLTQLVHKKLSDPLSEAKQLLKLLADDAEEISPRGRSSAQKTTQTLDRLVSLLNDLTQLEQIESGKIDLIYSELSSTDLANRAIENVQSLAAKKKLSLFCSGENLSFAGDRDRLTQVLINLLSNAIKFSPEGKQIEILSTKTGSNVEIRVIDEGPGIPKELQSKIFERYEQTKREDATAKGGAGLGLNICAVIARSHRGVLAVESEVGKGSQFYLRLPLSRSAGAESEESTEPPLEQAARKQSRGVRIWQKGLIVIAVPLLFQTIFVSLLSGVLDRARQETAQELHAMTVTASANEMFRNAINLGASAGGGYATAGSGMTIDQRVHSQEIKNLLSQISYLYDLEANDRKARSLVSGVFRASEKVLTNTSKMMLDPPPGQSVGTLMIIRKRVTAIQRSLDVFAENIGLLLEKQQAVERRSPGLRAQTRMQIMLLIIVSIAVSVVLSIVLGLYFSRGISERINKLKENTFRFSQGNELLPPLKGSDELCEFDSDFRAMVERLEASQEFKKHLLAVVSHELRTPLTSIFATLNLFIEGLYGDLREESRSKAQKAYDDIAEVIQLVNDLLDIERMEAGKFPLAISSVNLIELTEKIISDSPKLEKLKFKIENRTGGNPIVDADTELLSKAISRLLEFCIPELTSETITLSVEKFDSSFNMMVPDLINWLDPGENISNYEKFRMLEIVDKKNIDPRRKALSLSLALCKCILEQNKGKISSEHRSPGKQAFFILGLPAKEIS